MTTYTTNLLKNYMDQHDLKARDLIRLTDIAVSTAYKISRGEPVRDLDTLYKVYLGLKEAGYELTWFEVTGIE